ncbi:MAG: AmmeMemoRadiSam system protein A [Desulfovibrionaceae bacterium]|nr:AmmeMemoRadiSam system protein A [Desulfovibrionaceae bacterium]
MERFRFSLTDAEKSALKELVWRRIMDRLNGRDTGVPEPLTDVLREPYGAFVTLKRRDQLRGCIGHIVADRPLWDNVADMALAAAFDDPRFAPLTRAELDGLEVEITVLSPLAPCPDPERIEVGRHGLFLRRGMHSGLLLPQVAVEWGWDRRTFLRQTCRKAGLPEDAWRDAKTDIYWFEGVVF